MKPSALLANLRQRAEALSKDAALVGWFHRQGKDGKEFMPLGDLRVIAIYRGHKTRTYRLLTRKKKEKEKEIELKEEYPAYLISSPAVFFEGRVHVGGDKWFQRTRGPKTFFYRQEIPGSRPSGEFRDIISDNPQKEVTLVTSIKHERALADRQLCRWGLQLLGDNVDEQMGFNPFGDEEIDAPPFLVPRKRECLELREGERLRKLVMDATKRNEWHIDNLSGLSAPARGAAVRVGKVVEFVHDNGCEDQFSSDDVEALVEDLVFHVFGVRHRIDLRPAVPRGDRTALRAEQALFTPAPKGLTQKALEGYWEWENRRSEAQAKDVEFTETPPVPEATVQAMKYMAALTTLQDINGTPALNVDVAIGHSEPLVHMAGLMCRIQKIVNLEDNLIYESPGVSIDLPHVCQRMELQRRSEDFRQRVRKIRASPGVEVEDTQARVMYASGS